MRRSEPRGSISDPAEPELNVSIGGRGTGKSTVVQSIRYALGTDPVGDDARRLNDGIVRHVLRSGTRISLRVQVRRPAASRYRIERTISDPPLVRDAHDVFPHLLHNGTEPDLLEQDDRFVVRLWKERGDSGTAADDRH